MTKHVIDRPKTSDTTRAAKEFSRIEADQKPRPQTRILQKRTRTTSENTRLKAFAGIDRRAGS